MDGADDTVALLVVRCQLGERAALAELVRAWHVPLWNFMRRMAGGAAAADDLTQEAWLAVLRGLPRLREPERFVPWLFTIARRVLLNRLRAEYASRPGTGPEIEGVEAATDDVTLDRLELLAGVSELPLLEREVLVLFHIEDLSLRDCAEVLGVPEGTVKSRLSRARALLRNRLLEKGFHRDR